MQKSRTIFIGDVHGCYKELKALIKKLEIKQDDLIYFVGDLIHRGPDSYKVLIFLYKNRSQFKSIKGNHEVGFLKWFNGNNSTYELETNKKLKEKLIKKPKLLQFLRDLPIYIDDEKFLLVHGGIKYDKALKEHTVEELVNIRSYKGSLWFKSYKGKKKIIYGHNAVEGLQIRINTIGLDSGCVFGKCLSAYVLETGEVVTQNAFDSYVNIYKKPFDPFKFFKIF